MSKAPVLAAMARRWRGDGPQCISLGWQGAHSVRAAAGMRLRQGSGAQGGLPALAFSPPSLTQYDCPAIVLARREKQCSISAARPAEAAAARNVMYKKILVALENSRADTALLPHVAELAGHFHSELLLLHVADGWVARNFERMKLAESEEMKEDRAYLEQKAAELRERGLRVETQLALGEPSKEIVRTARREHCDLIAMTAHGHRLLGDLVFGSTINEVRHESLIPILVVRAAPKKSGV